MGSQRSFMEVYGDSLEQMLNVLVYMVPVDDDENDAAGFWSQSVYSVIDLFNLYRAVILRSLESLPVLSPGTDIVCINGSIGRADETLRHSRLVYTGAAFLLRIVRSVQVLIEMHAQRHHGAEHALRVCLRIEAGKLALKMFLRSRMPFSFYIDEEAVEEVEPTKVLRTTAAAAAAGGAGAPATPSGGYVGSRSGKALPALTAGEEAGAMPRILRRTDASRALPQLAMAELIYHGRPFVHLMLLLRRGRKSWIAWFVALLMDQASIGMLAQHLCPQANTRAARLEVGELQRRRQLLWWAFARSPVFDKFLQWPCEVLDRIISKIPVLNLFRIMELCLALQPFYFTSSAS